MATARSYQQPKSPRLQRFEQIAHEIAQGSPSSPDEDGYTAKNPSVRRGELLQRATSGDTSRTTSAQTGNK